MKSSGNPDPTSSHSKALSAVIKQRVMRSVHTQVSEKGFVWPATRPLFYRLAKTREGIPKEPVYL